MTLEERVRYVVDDLNAERYSKEIVDIYIEEAIQTISQETLSFFNYVTVTSDKDGYIEVPNNLQLVTAWANNCELELVYEGDVASRVGTCDWIKDTGNSLSDLRFLVYGSQNNSVFRTYPIIESLVGMDAIGNVLTATMSIKLAEVAEAVSTDKLVIKYVGVPAVDEVPSIWNKAIVLYTSGMLVRMDKDEQNRSFGGEQLQLFANELNSIKKLASKNYVR